MADGSIVASILFQRIRYLAKQARLAEEEKDLPQAASIYAQLAQWEGQYGEKYVSDSEAKTIWANRAANHRQYATQLLSKPSIARSTGNIKYPRDNVVAACEDGSPLSAIVDGLIVNGSPVRWSDIAGLDEVKAEIRTAFGIALAQRPRNVDLPYWDRILLYGPPGTGKSLIASAVAGSIPGSTFFNAQWSQLASKWYGETAKLMSLLYQKARERAPSVVFLDEVDTIAGRRDDNSRHEATLAASNVLLQEISGVRDRVSGGFVLTFAATNRPWALDEAFLSRFARAVYVPLPDHAARRQIFRIHLSDKGIGVAIPYDELAAMTEGYSGREIASICTEAIMDMVSKNNPDLDRIVDKGIDALRNYPLKLTPLVREDFDQAIARIRPMSSSRLTNAFASWRKEKGF